MTSPTLREKTQTQSSLIPLPLYQNWGSRVRKGQVSSLGFVRRGLLSLLAGLMKTVCVVFLWLLATTHTNQRTEANARESSGQRNRHSMELGSHDSAEVPRGSFSALSQCILVFSRHLLMTVRVAPEELHKKENLLVQTITISPMFPREPDKKTRRATSGPWAVG